MKKYYYSTTYKRFILAYWFPADRRRFNVLIKNKVYLETIIK